MNWAGTGSPSRLSHPHLQPSEVHSSGFGTRVEFLLCTNARRRYHEHHRNVPNSKRLQLTDPTVQRIVEFLPRQHAMSPLQSRDFAAAKPPMMMRDESALRRDGNYSPSRFGGMREPDIPIRSSPYVRTDLAPPAQYHSPRHNAPQPLAGPAMLYEPSNLSRMLFPDRHEDTRTKWSLTVPRVLLGVMCFLLFIMQCVLMDLYLYRHFSSAYLGFIAWDAVAGALLAFALFMPGLMKPGGGVDLMRYAWFLVMVNQVTKMCIMYDVVTVDIVRKYGTFDTFNGVSSLELACHLSIVLHAGLLYWCVGLSTPYEHTHAMAAATYLLSIMDLMDGIDMWQNQRYSTAVRFNSQLDHAIRVFVAFATVISPFCAYVAASEANTTERVWRRLTEFAELHLLTSFVCVSLPFLIIRLYLYYEYVILSSSVFIAKDLLCVMLVVFNPCAIRYGAAYFPTQI